MLISTLQGLLEIRLSTFILFALTTFAVISIASSVVKKIQNAEKALQLKKVAQKKRAQRDQQIKQTRVPDLNISNYLRDKILNSDATTLLEMLKTSQVTSEEILVTYFQRAITIGLEYELLTDIAFEEALVQARRCDKLRKENPSVCKGILFGLPLSMKELLILKDTDASCGLASRVFKPAQDDGYLIKILKGEGAIPFIKSNVPQAVLSLDSKNNIWGESKNPWNKERICGGSSGGEAGLIAARCSPLGIGNDLGGSIRIPAFCCGVVGFKPTGDRVTKAGTADMSPMLDYVPTLKLATGPIVKSVQDANLMMKALLSDQSHQNIRLSEQDPHYIRVDWKEEEVFKKHKNLRIGYFKSMEFFPLSPASTRAVEEAVSILRRKGYDIVEVEIPNFTDTTLIFQESMLADGEARFLFDVLKEETSIDAYDNTKLAHAVPSLVKKVLRPLLDRLGEKRVALMLGKLEKKTSYELIQLIGRQTKLRKEFFKIWEENKLDALISPGLAFPAIRPGFSKDIVYGVCYTTLFNVLELPTGALPVTVVKEGEDDYPEELTNYRDSMYYKTKETMQGSVGLPVGVQVSTLPWQDEKCINVMLQLEEELQFREKHPVPI